MLKRILVGFDGSQPSYKAFEFSLELATLCPNTEMEITVLSVAQPPEQADIVEMRAVIDNAKQYYEERFKELKEKAKEKNIEIKTEIAVGHPADQIVKYAKENNIDMIILGPKGKSKIESWLVGSVSKRVSTYSHCTVTIVK